MKEKFKWDGVQYSNASSLQSSIGELLMSSINFSHDDRVLDAGCGVGNITFKIAELVSDGYIKGIDLSQSMIDKCNETLNNSHIGNIEFQVMGLNEIPWKQEFNIIYSNSVLHWINDIKDVVERFYMALRKEGKVALQFPLLNDRHPLIVYADRTIRRLNLQSYYNDWVFPWYVPTSYSLEKVLADAGFHHVSVKVVRNPFSFKSVDKVYKHFLSVGLKLYVEVLPEELKKEFIDVVLQELRNDFCGEVTLYYERLFAYGDK